MKDLFLVGLGGSLGAVARFKFSGLILHQTLDWRFPVGTFLVNVAGCLVTGLLAGVIERYGLFTTETRLFLLTGVVGGFTTFSAFGLETVALLRRGHTGVALSYVVLSMLCGLAVLWLAMGAGSRRLF